MIDEKQTKNTIDMTNIFKYNAFSDGYVWMEYEVLETIMVFMDELEIRDLINSPLLWDKIGKTVFNMPYSQVNGMYRFIPPDYSAPTDANIIRKNTIGKIIKNLDSEPLDNILFSNNLKFILYNNSIDIDGEFNKTDPNAVNIVFNVISYFILKKIK